MILSNNDIFQAIRERRLQIVYLARPEIGDRGASWEAGQLVAPDNLANLA